MFCIRSLSGTFTFITQKNMMIFLNTAVINCGCCRISLHGHFVFPPEPMLSHGNTLITFYLCVLLQRANEKTPHLNTGSEKHERWLTTSLRWGQCSQSWIIKLFAAAQRNFLYPEHFEWINRGNNSLIIKSLNFKIAYHPALFTCCLF